MTGKFASRFYDRQRVSLGQAIEPSRRSAEHGVAQLRHSAEHGFTLIELLVVIVIIGLLSTVVVMTMADPRGRITSDADRFSGRVRAARDAAIISGRPVALWVSGTGYGFDKRENGSWQAISDGPLASKDWSSGATARFSGVNQLRMMFDSVGRADQPLDFQLDRDEQTIRVRVDLDGRVKSGG
jgi:general secretion pathway protein H